MVTAAQARVRKAFSKASKMGKGKTPSQRTAIFKKVMGKLKKK